VRNAALLEEGRDLNSGVKDFRFGLEIAVIQGFADRIVALLKVRDPLSERVHLTPTGMIGLTFAAAAGEIGRRVVGRHPVTKSAAGA